MGFRFRIFSAPLPPPCVHRGLVVEKREGKREREKVKREGDREGEGGREGGREGWRERACERKFELLGTILHNWYNWEKFSNSLEILKRQLLIGHKCLL